MARFIGRVAGQSGNEVHRLGSPNSGIRVTAAGWNVGVSVYGDTNGDADEFRVYATGGSNGGGSTFLGVVQLVDGVPAFIPA